MTSDAASWILALPALAAALPALVALAFGAGRELTVMAALGGSLAAVLSLS
jgi:hypothetical protein